MRSNQDNIKEAQQQKVLSLLKRSDMEIIPLSANQQNIVWEENGKEFAYNGMMYDVVKTENKKGETYLYCISDVKEKELVDNYNEITKQNASGKKEKINTDNSVNLFVYQTIAKSPLYFIIKTNNYSPFIVSLESTDPAIFSPPPEWICLG